jgi:hypothetical protein
MTRECHVRFCAEAGGETPPAYSPPGGALIDQELRRGSCSAHQAVQHTQPLPAPPACPSARPCSRSDATAAPRFVRAEDNPEIDSREDLRRSRSVMDLGLSPSSSVIKTPSAPIKQDGRAHQSCHAIQRSLSDSNNLTPPTTADSRWFPQFPTLSVLHPRRSRP